MSDKPTDESIAIVEAELEEAQAHARDLATQLHAMRCAKWGLEIGVTRVRESGTKAIAPKEGVVAEVRFIASGKPWVAVRFTRKDGSLSEAVRNLYSQWEII